MDRRKTQSPSWLAENSDKKANLPAQLNVSGPGNAELYCVPAYPLTDGVNNHTRVEVVRDKLRH
jgi:hypothetical protein